jgi:hypothetical protein
MVSLEFKSNKKVLCTTRNVDCTVAITQNFYFSVSVFNVAWS